MINAFPAYYRALSNGYRNFVPIITITLANTAHTVLNLTEADVWQNGLTIEDAVSGESDFQVGAAIINKCEIQLNNMDGRFTEYVFEGATVHVILRLNYIDDISGESAYQNIEKGTFTVNESHFEDTVINLECYDSMLKFDFAYDSDITYPTSVGHIVSDACAKCDVTFDDSGMPDGWGTLQVQNKPDGQSATYRNVISWCAQMFGRYARISNDNRLQIRWFSDSALAPLDKDGGIFDEANPYATGDNVDGGSFDSGSPYYSSGDSVNGGTFDGSDYPKADILEGVFTHNVSLDDVYVTGVRVILKNPDASSGSAILAYTEGQEGYLLEISDNPFIDQTNVNTVLNILGGQLIGMRFRKATVTHLANPVIEAGDVAYFSDRMGNEFHICVTKTVYTISDNQTTTCSAKDPARNNVQQFTESVRNYVDNYQLVRQESSLRQAAETELQDAIDSHSGLYTSKIESPPGSGSFIFYMHDMPELSDSEVVWKMTDEAIAVTTDYQADPVVWNFGVTVNGTVIANIMSTIGLDFDWGVGGELVIRDQNNNETLYANAANGIVRIRATEFSLSGNTIPQVIGAVQYGHCTTGSTTKAKVCTIPGFELVTGAKVSILFDHKNQAQAPTLNISDGNAYTGPKEIQAYGVTLTASDKYNWADNARVELVYDGVYWAICDSSSMAVSLDAVDSLDNSLNQQSVFDRLTNNGQTQGIYLNNGLLYINGTYMQIGKISSANRRVYFDLDNNEMACTRLRAAVDTYSSQSSLETVIEVQEVDQWVEDTSLKYHKYINIYKDGTSQRAYGLMIEPTSGTGLCNIRCAGGMKFYYPQGASILLNSNGVFLYDKNENPILNTNGTGEGAVGVEFPGAIEVKGNGSRFMYPPKLYNITSYGGSILGLGQDGATICIHSSSSKRYKDIDRELTAEDIEKAYDIKVYRAKYKDGYLQKSDPKDGVYMPMFVAENVEECIPEAVYYKEGKVEDWDFHVIIPVQHQMILDQNRRIKELESEVDALKSELKEIKELLLKRGDK